MSGLVSTLIPKAESWLKQWRDLGGDIRVEHDTDGAIRFVVLVEPAQTLIDGFTAMQRYLHLALRSNFDMHLMCLALEAQRAGLLDLNEGTLH